jgi:hypothetical protein
VSDGSNPSSVPEQAPSSSVPERAPSSSVPERAQRDEGRPVPQYGEYATPEEQRARIKQPDVTWAIETGQAPDDRVATPPAPPAGAPAPTSPPPPRGRGRTVDRVITIALLVYGLFNVVMSAPLMFALAEGEDGYLGLLGMTESLSDRAAAQTWGAIAGSVFVAGWLVTAWLSWAMLRRGRISFWIPIVGAVVVSGLAVALMLIPAFGDPAFVAFMQQYAENPLLP